MKPHQICLQAKVKHRNEPKQAVPKSEHPSRSLEMNAIWRLDTEVPTIFNKSCTYNVKCPNTGGVLIPSQKSNSPSDLIFK